MRCVNWRGDMSPVCIFTRNNFDVNWSLTVKTWSGSMSFVLGSFESTRCVILPSASDCSERARSRSGMSVSFLISWQWHINTSYTALSNIQPVHRYKSQWHHICTPHMKKMLLRYARIGLWFRLMQKCFGDNLHRWSKLLYLPVYQVLLELLITKQYHSTL